MTNQNIYDNKCEEKFGMLPENAIIELDRMDSMHNKDTDSKMLRILVVDDEPLIVHCISDMIQELRPKDVLDKATNVQDAYVLLDSNQYDVLISDYNMPSMTGTMLGRLAREKQETCKVVIITGSNDIEDILAEKASDMIMRKPINWKHLLRLLARFTEDLKGGE